MSLHFIQLNSDKSELLIIGPGNTKTGIYQCIVLLVPNVTTNSRNLGVLFYPQLKCNHHVNKLVKLGRRLLSTSIIQAFILPCLNYFTALFTCLKSNCPSTSLARTKCSSQVLNWDQLKISHHSCFSLQSMMDFISIPNHLGTTWPHAKLKTKANYSFARSIFSYNQIS